MRPWIETMRPSFRGSTPLVLEQYYASVYNLVTYILQVLDLHGLGELSGRTMFDSFLEIEIPAS